MLFSIVSELNRQFSPDMLWYIFHFIHFIILIIFFSGSGGRNFVTADPSLDSIQDGWSNGYTYYSANGVSINNGLTLTLSNEGCNPSKYSSHLIRLIVP